jgi:hypothetical protein
MTEPLTPPDCDLRDWPSMLLDVVRLRDSSLASDETPEACWAAVLLWAASWHQVPAASIPDDDRWIAKQAGYAQRGKIDTKAWARVRDGALRHFTVCSDGRRYHRVVAEKALECWLEKLARCLSSGAGNAKRWKQPFDPKPIEEQMQTARAMLVALNPHSRALTRRKTSGVPFQSEEHPDGIPDEIPPGSQEKGNGTEGEGSSDPKGSAGAGAPAAVDKSTNPEPPTVDPAEVRRQLWVDTGTWLVSNGLTTGDAKAFMNTVMKDHPAVGAEAFREALKTVAPADCKAFVQGIAKRLAADRQKTVTVPSADPEKTAAYLAAQAADRPAPGAKVPDSVREARARMGPVHAPAPPADEERAAA